MNELTHLTAQKESDHIEETMPEVERLQDETKRLMRLIKKGNYRDSDMLDIHSLIKLAKAKVEQLRIDKKE